MLKTIVRPVWRIWNIFLSNTLLSTHDGHAYVVVGFARSGTSMVCELLHAAGVWFGEPASLMQPDTRNPRGFFEHRIIFLLTRACMKQAGMSDDLPIAGKNLRAKGTLRRVQRFITRAKMLRTLRMLSLGHSSWGFKAFPTPFYFWRGYLPKYTVIGVYRDPLAVVESFMSSWRAGRLTVDDVLEYWRIENRNMLYHVLSSKGILLRYEDLLNETTRPRVLRALAAHLGVTETAFEGVITNELNRSEARIVRLQKYPLPKEVSDLLAILKDQAV